MRQGCCAMASIYIRKYRNRNRVRQTWLPRRPFLEREEKRLRSELSLTRWPLLPYGMAILSFQAIATASHYRFADLTLSICFGSTILVGFYCYWLTARQLKELQEHLDEIKKLLKVEPVDGPERMP